MKEKCAKLSALYNPDRLPSTFASVRSIRDSLVLSSEQGEPCLRAIARVSGDGGKQIRAILILNITLLCARLNLKNSLSESDVDFIADEVIKEFGFFLTMADVHLILSRARSGGFGKFYERISPDIVVSWFRRYSDERLNEAEQFSRTNDCNVYGESESRPNVIPMDEERRRSKTNNAYMQYKAKLQQESAKTPLRILNGMGIGHGHSSDNDSS